jgi:hypothetical protein
MSRGSSELSRAASDVAVGVAEDVAEDVLTGGVEFEFCDMRQPVCARQTTATMAGTNSETFICRYRIARLVREKSAELCLESMFIKTTKMVSRRAGKKQGGALASRARFLLLCVLICRKRMPKLCSVSTNPFLKMASSKV